MEACLHTLTIALRERLNRFRNVAGNGIKTVREFATTGLQSPRNVGDAQVRMGFQVLNEIVGGLLKRLLRAGGQKQQLSRACRVAGSLRGWLFKNDVGICATNPESANSCPPRQLLALPFRQFGVHVEGGISKIELRIWLLKVQC